MEFELSSLQRQNASRVVKLFAGAREALGGGDHAAATRVFVSQCVAVVGGMDHLEVSLVVGCLLSGGTLEKYDVSDMKNILFVILCEAVGLQLEECVPEMGNPERFKGLLSARVMKTLAEMQAYVNSGETPVQQQQQQQVGNIQVTQMPASEVAKNKVEGRQWLRSHPQCPPYLAGMLEDEQVIDCGGARDDIDKGVKWLKSDNRRWSEWVKYLPSYVGAYEVGPVGPPTSSGGLKVQERTAADNMWFRVQKKLQRPMSATVVVLQHLRELNEVVKMNTSVSEQEKKNVNSMCEQLEMSATLMEELWDDLGDRRIASYPALRSVFVSQNPPKSGVDIVDQGIYDNVQLRKNMVTTIKPTFGGSGNFGGSSGGRGSGGGGGGRGGGGGGSGGGGGGKWQSFGSSGYGRGRGHGGGGGGQSRGGGQQQQQQQQPRGFGGSGGGRAGSASGKGRGRGRGRF